MTRPTIRLTVAQAVVTYLSRQYSVADGGRRRLIPATLGIFGHGNVAGLGQALDQLDETPCRSSRAATSRPWCTPRSGSPSTPAGVPPSP